MEKPQTIKEFLSAAGKKGAQIRKDKYGKDWAKIHHWKTKGIIPVGIGWKKGQKRDGLRGKKKLDCNKIAHYFSENSNFCECRMTTRFNCE